MSTATMQTLTRFWLALERLPSQAAVAAHWRHLIGSDFELASRLMVPDSRLATSFPRFDRPGLDYTVIEHGSDDFVGICEDDGDRTRLTRADLVIYRVDPTKLVAAVAAAFGLEVEGTPVAELAATFRVGTYRPLAGFAVPVYLTVQLEHTDYKAVVDALLAATPGSFVLLAPTNRHHRIACQLLLEARPCLFLPLADAIRSDSPRWQVTDAAHAALTAFTAKLIPAVEQPAVEEPLSERAQDVLVAMLELGAMDSDRRQSTARITERAFGRDADANSLKPLMKDLARNRFIDTMEGRGGGCWLTERGLRRAQKLKEQDENG